MLITQHNAGLGPFIISGGMPRSAKTILPDALPRDLEAEKDVLAAILRNEKALEDTVLRMPAEELFYDRRHRIIYKAILGLYHRSEPVDTTTVAAAIGDAKLKTIGGRVYLAKPPERIASTAHTSSHVDIVATKGHLRQLILEGQRLIDDASSPEADPNEVRNRHETQLCNVTDIDRIETIDIETAAPEFAKTLLGHSSDVDLSQILGTRIPELNTKLGGGLHKGHLVVIGGSPSMGKSSLGLDIVLYNGNFGKRSIIFTNDEPSSDILQRAFQANLGFEPFAINSRGPWTDEQQRSIAQTADALKDQLWSVVEAAGMTATDIRSHARAYKRRYDQLDIVMVDYIGLIRPVRRGGTQTREGEIADISGILKEMATQLGCCVIPVSQLNRSVTTEPLQHVNTKAKRRVPLPRMSHLKDRGAIEADSQCRFAAVPALRVP